MSSLLPLLALLGLSPLASAARAPAGFVPLPRLSESLSARAANDTSAAFLSCLSAASLSPVVAAAETYANDSASYNQRLPVRPAALVYPEDAKGVSEAVKCASKSGVKVNARSGGHSYAAFGLGGEDGHLVVSLENLDEISLDGDGIATIGAGNRLGDVALGIWEQGQRAMAHGTCPYVGVGGHAGHGGFGLSSRNWGTVLDQTVEIEVVTADGEIVKASRDEMGDLFWAMQGAASSFGIVTSFKTVTHAPPAHNIWFTYTWDNLTASQASQFHQMWQNFALTLPAEFGFQIHVNPQAGGTPNFIVDGYYYGDEGEEIVNSTMQKLLDDYGIAPNVTDIQDQTWMQQIDFLAGVDAQSKLNTHNTPDTYDTFYATSIFVSERELMSQDAADALFHYLWTTASEAQDTVAWYLIWDLWGGEQSYITNVTEDANAFDARDALYSIQLWGQSLTGELPMPSNGVSVIQGMVKSITDNQPNTQFKGYMNYVDSELSREDAWAYYYPTHTAELRRLKTQFDPNDTFSFPQSILPQ